ncbi:MAG: DeoR family transcriptional regulator, partial [Pseudomonadota bacterium]
MHEKERHTIILSAVEERPIVTVVELCNLTGASEATIRRDIATLDEKKVLRRVRGGAEALSPPQFVGLAAAGQRMHHLKGGRAAVDDDRIAVF